MEVNYDKFIDDGVGLIIHPSEQTMTDELQYWEGSDIHDLTLDEMIAEIESYIKFVRHVFFMYPDFEISGSVRIGFHQKPNSDRCELVCWDPPLDSVYTTVDVVDAICEKYPDLLTDPGRNTLICEQCGGDDVTITVHRPEPDAHADETMMTCNKCNHVERHGLKCVNYRHHDIWMYW